MYFCDKRGCLLLDAPGVAAIMVDFQDAERAETPRQCDVVESVKGAQLAVDFYRHRQECSLRGAWYILWKLARRDWDLISLLCPDFACTQGNDKVQCMHVTCSRLTWDMKMPDPPPIQARASGSLGG